MLFRRRAHCRSLAADAAVCPKVRYNYTSSRLEVHARLDKVQLRKLCPAFDIKLVQERPHLARSSTYQAQKKFGGFSNYFTISEQTFISYSLLSLLCQKVYHCSTLVRSSGHAAIFKSYAGRTVQNLIKRNYLSIFFFPLSKFERP